jgi:hypothetical protein
MLVAAALTISATSALAQEPAEFQAMYPDRDVLNGGALTPAGRQGLQRPFGAAGTAGAASDYEANNAAMSSAGPSFRAPRRHHTYDPATRRHRSR